MKRHTAFPSLLWCLPFGLSFLPTFRQAQFCDGVILHMSENKNNNTLVIAQFFVTFFFTYRWFPPVLEKITRYQRTRAGQVFFTRRLREGGGGGVLVLYHNAVSACCITYRVLAQPSLLRVRGPCPPASVQSIFNSRVDQWTLVGNRYVNEFSWIFLLIFVMFVLFRSLILTDDTLNTKEVPF